MHRSEREDAYAPRLAAVIVTGVDLPFWDLVLLLFKVALAALPAAVMVAAVWFTLGAVIAGLARGMR